MPFDNPQPPLPGGTLTIYPRPETDNGSVNNSFLPEVTETYRVQFQTANGVAVDPRALIGQQGVDKDGNSIRLPGIGDGHPSNGQQGFVETFVSNITFTRVDNSAPYVWDFVYTYLPLSATLNTFETPDIPYLDINASVSTQYANADLDGKPIGDAYFFELFQNGTQFTNAANPPVSEWIDPDAEVGVNVQTRSVTFAFNLTAPIQWDPAIALDLQTAVSTDSVFGASPGRIQYLGGQFRQVRNPNDGTNGSALNGTIWVTGRALFRYGFQIYDLSSVGGPADLEVPLWQHIKAFRSKEYLHGGSFNPQAPEAQTRTVVRTSNRTTGDNPGGTLINGDPSLPFRLYRIYPAENLTPLVNYFNSVWTP